jgi:sirohydrochlorin cobaltochelatase
LHRERAPDSLPTTVQELAAAGVRQVRIVPMFLGVGRHAREDLPQLVAQLRVDHPHLNIELQAAVGEDERMVYLLADMAVGPTR